MLFKIYPHVVVMCFEAVLGLTINLSKSETVQVGEVMNIEELVSKIGYCVLSIPMNYLGYLWGIHLGKAFMGFQF